MELKIGFTVPEKYIDSIIERKKNSKDNLDEIIRDELDKLIDDKFFSETIPQIKSFISGYEEFNAFDSNLPKPNNGRGKRIHHGRHKK